MTDTGLVFDVDGVLVDTSLSFPAVVSAAVQIGAKDILGYPAPFRLFDDEHYNIARRSPMFNDDYDIAWVFLSWIASGAALQGGGGPVSRLDWERLIASCDGSPEEWCGSVFQSPVDRGSVRKTCEEIYFGEEQYLLFRGVSPEIRIGGLWKRERPCLEKEWESLDIPTGIYTGRNRQELQLALNLLGWDGFPPHLCITPDEGISKPSPRGLKILEERLSVSRIIFFGDSESDRKAFEAYGKGLFVPIGPSFDSERGGFPDIRTALEFPWISKPQ